MSLTPNDEKEALKSVTNLARQKPNARNPFQLLSCPWCGTEMANPERLGYTEYKGRMVFLCPSGHGTGNSKCPFSTMGQHLPITVVDETIYKEPPTLIIGTVDKFAMLAWRAEAGRILTAGGGLDLIIQDELHLITGPLGSMVGLYEGAIDFLARRGGDRPKIVASTATIRRAAAQCAALYDRPVRQFPPPGIDASDSYFACVDASSPGRGYVGLLPTGASSPLTAQIRSVVALQQGVPIVCGPEAADEVVDPYWTLIQYFSSIKELGRAATFLSADIPEFLPTMHRRYSVQGAARRWLTSSDELTSRKNEEEIPEILRKLEVRYRRESPRADQALDTILATNMISVGVDIDRLGLMMVVTQPKGTSEYIQATSRVGRSKGGPGLAFTLYNASRARDRSHYEQFRGYHESFYRFVEPTSVTPFAPPALERALHAILVIGGRHGAGWSAPSEFDQSDDRFAAFVQFLRRRAGRVDPVHLGDFEGFLARRLEEWSESNADTWGSVGGDPVGTPLMRVAGSDQVEETGEKWETPTSMRSVDVECGVEVVARYPREEQGK